MSVFGFLYNQGTTITNGLLLKFVLFQFHTGFLFIFFGVLEVPFFLFLFLSSSEDALWLEIRTYSIIFCIDCRYYIMAFP